MNIRPVDFGLSDLRPVNLWYFEPADHRAVESESLWYKGYPVHNSLVHWYRSGAMFKPVQRFARFTIPEGPSVGTGGACFFHFLGGSKLAVEIRGRSQGHAFLLAGCLSKR